MTILLGRSFFSEVLYLFILVRMFFFGIFFVCCEDSDSPLVVRMVVSTTFHFHPYLGK